MRYDREIAVVRLDNPPVNALSTAVRAALCEMVATLDADETVRAVVLICAGRTFISGADAREFDLPPVEPHLPDVVDSIDAAAKPWTAAIHGSALGGGFEIAIGCRYRVAVDGAKLGLPEVLLGLIPGASGTVRTPRLVGVAAAVELATTGRPWSAVKAHAAGILDQVVRDDLEGEAIAFARAALDRDMPLPVSRRPIEGMPHAFWDLARKAASKAGHQAPLRALECLRFATEVSFEAAMRKERETFLQLRGSEEAAALRYVFFAERSAARPERAGGVEPRLLKTIGVVGGGTMGAAIAVACRNAGLPVVLVERDNEAARKGIANIEKIFAGAVKSGQLDETGRTERMAGVTVSSDYAALADCDLVIEAVFEEITVKRAVFAELGRVCRAGAVLATNTSYLDPRDIALGVPYSQRFVGLHFFSPAHLMKLLEIVPTPGTAEDVLATAFELARRLDKVPVQAGICEGFIGNRILKRYRAEAEALVGQGVPIGEIDAAVRDFGFKMGPFEAQDLGGLDIAFLQRESARAAGRIVPETLGDILVRAGRKGQKTGGGWYDYAEGDRTPKPSSVVDALLSTRVARRKAMSAQVIAERLVSAMAAEGRAILDEGVAATPSEIDLVEIHGYGFPRWKGGPMWMSGVKN